MRLPALLIPLAVVLAGPALAQCDFVPEQTVDVAPGGLGIAFTDAVALHGEVAVVATDLVSLGQALVFSRAASGWGLIQILRPSLGALAPFGHPVAFDGETILLGSSGTSSAYVFSRRDGLWNEDQALRIEGTRDLQYFGHSVALDGDLAAIGAPGNAFTSGTPRDPAVHLYRRIDGEWTLEETLRPPAGEAGMGFGLAVAVDDGRVAVGRPFPPARVSLYRFDGAAWAPEQDVFPVDADSGHAFGHSLVLKEDVLLVGSPRSVPSGSGLAFVFRLRDGSFRPEQRLLAGLGSGSFGTSVHLDGRTAVIGDPAQLGVPAGSHPGRVFVYAETNQRWREAQVLSPAGGLGFGSTVAASEGTLLAGASGSETDGVLGAAHFYTNRLVDRATLARGNVNEGTGAIRDVLFLNGSSGGRRRVVEYDVLGSFSLSMNGPPALTAGETAPFALYLWLGQVPESVTPQRLPFGIGCSVLPMIDPGNGPRPRIVWNNAGRVRWLGRATRPSGPAPTRLVHRPNGPGRAARFFVQGLIFDPGSAAPVPASITNGIEAVPVFRP